MVFAGVHRLEARRLVAFWAIIGFIFHHQLGIDLFFACLNYRTEAGHGLASVFLKGWAEVQRL